MRLDLRITNTSQYHDHPRTFIDFGLKGAKPWQPIFRSPIMRPFFCCFSYFPNSYNISIRNHGNYSTADCGAFPPLSGIVQLTNFDLWPSGYTLRFRNWSFTINNIHSRRKILRHLIFCGHYFIWHAGHLFIIYLTMKNVPIPKIISTHWGQPDEG